MLQYNTLLQLRRILSLHYYVDSGLIEGFETLLTLKCCIFTEKFDFKMIENKKGTCKV